MNEALTPLRLLKLGPYKHGEKQLRDLQLNLNQAMKKVKLNDFGDMEFVDHFNFIMNSPIQKAQVFTNIGYVAATIELSMNFVRRLTFTQYLKDVPSVKKIELRSPVFVMGLPRTGTTFLHRLLSLDPAVRAPLLWELLHPVPRPKDIVSEKAAFEADRNKRMNHIRKILEQRKTMGDHAVEHIHEVEYDLPEECLMGLTDALPVMLQYLYSNYMNVKGYLTMDSTKAYESYGNMLRLLSYQCGEAQNPKRWMLKCPIHLFYIKQISKVFPDAKLIWTHRHPVSAVPSLCSLVKAFHSVYYEPECLDVNALGKSIAQSTGEILRQATQDMAETKLAHSDVVYNDLVKDPIECVRSIYEKMGWTFSDEYLDRLKAYLLENKQKRDSVNAKNGSSTLHHYSPASYGIAEDELSTGLYADYCKKYNVPMSRN